MNNKIAWCKMVLALQKNMAPKSDQSQISISKETINNCKKIHGTGGKRLSDLKKELEHIHMFPQLGKRDMQNIKQQVT